MSGFEIAGVVLGGLPIVIQGLESYSKGLSKIQKWRKYDREVRILVRNLETERVKLENVCYMLLVGIVPASRVEQMVQHPGGNLWRENKTQDKIRSRLHDSAAVFEEALRDIDAAIREIQKKIPSPGTKISTFKKTAFTLKRPFYEELLLTIRVDIENLEKLTNQSIKLEPARRSRSQARLLKTLREVSKSLDRAFQSSLMCTCRHVVGMKLEQRPADRRVAFAAFQKQSIPMTTLIESTTSAQMDVQAAGVGAARLTQPAPAMNLCEKIRKSQEQPDNNYYGELIDHQQSGAMQYSYGVYLVSGLGNRTGPMLSLRDLLESLEDNPISPFPYLDRLRLAVILSYSVLQLHSTPWLPNMLTSRDIFFAKHDGYPIFESPFILKDPQRDLGPSPPPKTPFMRNPALLSLGVLLVELIQGKTVDALRTPHERDMESTSSSLLVDFVTVQRLLPRIQMASSNYGTAVMQCTDGDFHRHDDALEDEDIREQIYSGVVALLEKDLENSR
ncbi:hypothetical protein GQ53DRAFT_650168 [Thozetella sp. PMI_491]|nr:hypothetical protein GQ53DRAFT_650168 [Thozetella sp. PMI_491]